MMEFLNMSMIFQFQGQCQSEYIWQSIFCHFEWIWILVQSE